MCADGSSVHNDPRMVSCQLQNDASLAPLILILRRGKQIVCIAPFYIQPAGFSFEFSVWRTKPIQAQVLRMFGEAAIVSKDFDVDRCVQMIAEFLRVHATSCAYFQVYGMDHSNRFWRAAIADNSLARHANCAILTMRHETIHQVPLKGSFDEYVASLSPSTRQTLRYGCRRLFRDGDVRIERCALPTQVAQLLRWVSTVYSNSWQAKTFGSLSLDEAAQHSLLEQTAREGWLRSYVLLRGEEPMAYQLGYLYDRVYYLLDCAYDQRFAAGSPGSVLTFRVMEDLHADKSTDCWDFGFGDMPYKRHFHSVEHDASTVYFVPRNRWRHIIRLQSAINATYDRIRNGFVRIGVDTFIRKLVKRQR
jgi:hypothetical protein